jgi:atypical dual specificity phosphatase
LRQFGVAFGDSVILADITLDIPQRGTLVLVGPSGSGKSTLLRTICGLNDAQPALKTWGQADFQGKPLGTDNRPGLVMQKARLMIASVRENLVSALPNRSALSKPDQTSLTRTLLYEYSLAELSQRLDSDVMDLPLQLQRRLSIVRMAASKTPLICIDEPTAGMTDLEAVCILDLIQKLAERQAVIFVTHNQSHARAVGGTTALLAGGRIQETASTSAFFDSPGTASGKQFVSSGQCKAPTPNAKKEDLAEDVTPPPPLSRAAQRAMKQSSGLKGFYWVKKGALGGLPRPGLFNKPEDDLEALQNLGITVLVTLEETKTVDAKALRHNNIKGLFVPINDMEAPTVEAAEKLCAEIDELNRAGEVVAVHCRAGLGRTGTLLACQLIWDGATALEALESARSINHYWIQSMEQVNFLDKFARALNEKATGRTKAAVSLG